MYPHEIVIKDLSQAGRGRPNVTKQRESVIEGTYFCQLSVIYFCRGFRNSPY